MKNQVLLENYYLPGELKTRISKFVDYYNDERYHESLNNLTPADVYYGRGQSILDRRERIKLKRWRCVSKTIMITELISSIDGRDTLLD